MARGPSHIAHNLGDISKNIAKSSGVNAKISIQKIYAYWEDIVGTDFAQHAVPYHISWGKAKKQKAGFSPMGMPPMTQNTTFPTKSKSAKTPLPQAPQDKKFVATLHIAASSAIATKLLYQEIMIIERIQRVIGSSAIQYISVKHESGLDNLSAGGYKIPRKLNEGEKEYLCDALDSIQDDHIKQSLKSLGEKILLEKNE